MTVNKRRKIRTILAVLLCTALFYTGGENTVLASEPSGPASDTQVEERSKMEEQPVGPGAKTEGPAEEIKDREGQASENADSNQDAESGQGGQQTETGEESQGELSQPENPGIMSGGRLLDPSKPMVALTFDDGPYAPVGNRIMDLFERYNGRATFFVVGNRVNSYQDEIRRMKEDGHEIGNHSYSHKYLQKLGAEQIRAEIEGANQAVAAVTGEAPALVRLPGGGHNATVLANIHQPVILWNVDTRDWATRNADQTAAAVLGKVKDGDIVLMHELYPSTADAVERIVPALTEQGFQLVTVSELIQFRGGASPGVIYYSFPG